MAYSNRSPSSTLSDYTHLRSLPAMLSVLFIAASAFQFGAIAPIEFQWYEYTLDPTHAVYISIGVFAVAFASSETKEFTNYEGWERVAIAAGPVLIVGYEYSSWFADVMANNDPTLHMIAFLVTLISWGVAVR